MEQPQFAALVRALDHELSDAGDKLIETARYLERSAFRRGILLGVGLGAGASWLFATLWVWWHR